MDMKPAPEFYGPNTKPLLVFTWKLQFFPKLKHFFWKQYWDVYLLLRI